MRPALALPAVLVAFAPLGAQGLPGQYQLVSAPDLDAGISQVMEGLPFFQKPLAQQRLHSVNPAYRRVTLDRGGEAVTIQFDGRKPLQVPLKGGITWTREDGEAFWVTAESHGNLVRQTYHAKDGERTNEFELTPHGDLVLRVTVRSHKLPSVLKYQMVYRRSV
ncbi:MAG: hypothetical protein U0P81_08910 [Holophagaceae bacterium]